MKLEMKANFYWQVLQLEVGYGTSRQIKRVTLILSNLLRRLGNLGFPLNNQYYMQPTLFAAEKNGSNTLVMSIVAVGLSVSTKCQSFYGSKNDGLQ